MHKGVIISDTTILIALENINKLWLLEKLYKEIKTTPEVKEEFGEPLPERIKVKDLTQEQLGELIGVQKSQISKLERNTKNVTIETILKVLKANVKFSVEMNEFDFKVA